MPASVSARSRNDRPIAAALRHSPPAGDVEGRGASSFPWFRIWLGVAVAMVGVVWFVDERERPTDPAVEPLPPPPVASAPPPAWEEILQPTPLYTVNTPELK